MVDTVLGGAGAMESEFVGEVCMREFRQDLARRDAERQRRSGTRGVRCGLENGFVLSASGERGILYVLDRHRVKGVLGM